LALIKFVLLAVISAVSLYFIITSIQNFIQLQSEVENAQREVKAAQREVKAAQQALKNYEQSTKQVDLAKRQLEHEIDWIQKEEEFYFSHGCAKNNTDAFLCPPNTPKFVYEPEPKV
jgi:Skp family chaperone for outer membrane proteins